MWHKVGADLSSNVFWTQKSSVSKMSSADVLNPPTVGSKPSGGQQHNNNHQKHPSKASGNANNSKRKNKYDRGSRKRSKSFTGGLNIHNHKPVLPSKFLLGGNIKDPLNLNSLQDEEINRAMNAVTPKSSPVPTPPRKKGQLEVIIPKNIHDPLNLIDCEDDAEYEQQLNSPVKKSKKKRLKKRRTISVTMDTSDTTADLTENSEAKTPEDSAKVPEIPEAANKPSACKDLSIDLGCPKKEKNKRKSDEHANAVKKFKNNMDKIVSPVVPQPGAWLKRSTSVNKPKPRHNKSIVGELKMPEFKEKSKQFQYGNYNRYYGYRNPLNEMDQRLRAFSHHTYLFENKDILDIGCNIGHITLCVARDFRAKSVLGIDIDPKLISIARKNVKHYVKTRESPRGDDESPRGHERTKKKSSEFFPISMPILYGAIDIPGFNDDNKGKKRGFPNNVTFKQCNYILEDDNLINLEQPQFDVILCLSITKWIHLNWGDGGIKQAFRRIYAQLRPGGKLILEPQHWASYKNKKKLTETIYRNYNTIEFFPEKFREYLLSPAVGFAKSEILGYPPHQCKGFRRPIQVFTKSTMFPSERIEATPFNTTPNVGSYNYPYSDRQKTDNKTHAECVEHVYTDIFDNRYCSCADDNTEMNEKLSEDLRNVAMQCSPYETTGSSVRDSEDTNPGYTPLRTESSCGKNDEIDSNKDSQSDLVRDSSERVESLNGKNGDVEDGNYLSGDNT